MKVIDTYKNPNDTWEERKAKLLELWQPITDNWFRNPEKYGEALFFLKETPDGRQYTENYNGTVRYKVPCHVKPGYDGVEVPVFEPFDEDVD